MNPGSNVVKMNPGSLNIITKTSEFYLHDIDRNLRIECFQIAHKFHYIFVDSQHNVCSCCKIK